MLQAAFFRKDGEERKRRSHKGNPRGRPINREVLVVPSKAPHKAKVSSHLVGAQGELMLNPLHLHRCRHKAPQALATMVLLRHNSWLRVLQHIPGALQAGPQL